MPLGVRLSRRGALLAGLGLSAALGYWYFSASEERRVLAAVSALARAVSSESGETAARRRARLGRALGEHAAPNLAISVPELGEIEGADALHERLDDLGGAVLELGVERPEVRVRGESARVTLFGTLRWLALGEEWRDTRPVVVELVRRGERWRVSRVEVEERSRAQPEARP